MKMRIIQDEGRNPARTPRGLGRADAPLFGARLTGRTDNTQTSEGRAMEAVDAELDRLVSKRASSDARPDPDEEHELWEASVERHNARVRAENASAWLSPGSPTIGTRPPGTGAPSRP